MSKKLDQAFGAKKVKEDEAASFISTAEAARGQKPAELADGSEAVSARSMCLSLSVRQNETIEKLAFIQKKSKAAVVREAIDLYIKRNKKDIEEYEAFEAWREQNRK